MTRTIATLQGGGAEPENERRYEAPWLVVFDGMHWEGHADELRHFLRELVKSGRPTCVLIVTGPYLGLDFLDNRTFCAARTPVS